MHIYPTNFFVDPKKGYGIKDFGYQVFIAFFLVQKRPKSKLLICFGTVKKGFFLLLERAVEHSITHRFGKFFVSLHVFLMLPQKVLLWFLSFA